MQAKGAFEVQLKPAPPEPGRTRVGRMMMDKQYFGDLVATAQGEMLSAGNPATGSASYVAIEHVSGALNGKQGDFALAHTGTMHNSANDLTISIVPGSGTGELTGIDGKLTLSINGDQHFYEINYTLP
ncbi:DUF3224 domain-containing protein [Massilia sp. RP-1-19]|uniref:DUF3224 domain-containing protein n=1 Tax=Massilia polaris TaxID=2728846 RepID=A0A848HJV2_9BURK|nr:DUF3224 domain-containing protein [Massilia polaris]NML60231.1 DUF3224 domain-containing protein [Massilia polaris]